jgi:hypothetical protein
MFRLRAVVAVLVSYSMLGMSLNGATPAAIGTVTSAISARVGEAEASKGTTVFGGDHLSTDKFGNIQIRTGAARFLLTGSSSASIGTSTGIPSATLLSGTAVFSTANANAFVLHASKADIRPQSDLPTVAQVTYVSDKELRVKSTRGSLTVTVEGETKPIPEGGSYRVILDPDSYYSAENAQGPRGVGGSRSGGPPRRAGTSHFLLIAIIVTSVASGIVLYEALQSPSKP